MKTLFLICKLICLITKIFQPWYFYIFLFKDTDWFDVTDCNFFVTKSCNLENFK